MEKDPDKISYDNLKFLPTHEKYKKSGAVSTYQFMWD